MDIIGEENKSSLVKLQQEAIGANARAHSRRALHHGYVGEDVENIILRLVQSADYNVERAVYIDEIDETVR
jgi:hypothetical protein